MNRIVINLFTVIFLLAMALVPVWAQKAAGEIVDLIESGAIEVETIGNGIESMQIRMRRTGTAVVTVQIPVGTFFLSNNNAAQNMVSRASRTVTLSGLS